MTIQGKVAMQVTQPGGQLWNPCKWRRLMTKFQANASGATRLTNCQLMQVTKFVNDASTTTRWTDL